MVLCVLFIASSGFCKVGFGQTDVPGCTDPDACNFDITATENDDSCEYFSCLAIGCNDSEACNYDPTADFNDGSCTYPEPLYNCDGVCEVDSDLDGVCDANEVLGCQSANACNYNEFATDDDGTCDFCAGCMNPLACNYDESYTVNCFGCCDLSSCYYGCTNPDAPNYDPTAWIDDGTCEEIEGCTDATACNFEDAATQDDASCTYASEGYDCLGACLLDTDDDGVCDEFEIGGCTDPEALNFSNEATDEDDSCTYPPEAVLPPAEFDFTPTPFSGTFIGTITLDNLACEEVDWVAAFDPDGNCAGSAPLFMDGGVAYVVLPIYGDESLTSLIDEGLADGESFTLQLFDASTLTVHEYYEETGVVEFDPFIKKVDTVLTKGDVRS